MLGTLWGHVKRMVLRTTQPYEIQVRTIIGFDLFLLFCFAILVFVRYLVARDCPDVVALGSNHASVVSVGGACPSEGWKSEFTVSIIDNLAAGLVVALVTSWLIWLMSPKWRYDEDIAALAPWNIRPALLSPLPNTRRYHYRGRSGRFLRSKVVPELFRAGEISATRRELFLLLPDPSDTKMLAEYAHYRNSLANSDGFWDVERIQTEILSTILFTAYKSNSNQFFEAKIYLKSDFSLLRLDMSEQRLILTREDESWPAIVCSKHSKFYASYEEEFHMEARNGIELAIGKADLPDKFNAAHVNPALAALGISMIIPDEQSKKIIQAIRKPKLPYV